MPEGSSGQRLTFDDVIVFVEQVGTSWLWAICRLESPNERFRVGLTSSRASAEREAERAFRALNP